MLLRFWHQGEEEDVEREKVEEKEEKLIKEEKHEEKHVEKEEEGKDNYWRERYKISI